MTDKQKKAVIFAPFWRQIGHVGNNRVDRFVRWLAEDGYNVVIILAGSTNDQRDTPWGQEIAVRDPLGLYRDASIDGKQPAARKPNKLRRSLSYWFFNPDPTVVWARLAAKHPLVMQASKGAAFILSSSPPESSHLGAWKLSRCLKIPHIVDMRDGWLDEPLKPLLRSSALRRWQEGRMEARILRDAALIQVTSDVWQELLCQRLSELSAKVKVLTNGYPQHMPEKDAAEGSVAKDGLLLIHAGRFLGSRLTQRPEFLLQPLLDAVTRQGSSGVIQLLGQLSAEELTIIDRFKAPLAAHGWTIDCPGNLPRQELLQRLPQADGLLLLSASYAAIPSKLFEYIPTGKSMFVVTEKNSATWRICEELPQAVVMGLYAHEGIGAVVNYITKLQTSNFDHYVPKNYEESCLKNQFIGCNIGKLLGDSE